MPAVCCSYDQLVSEHRVDPETVLRNLGFVKVCKAETHRVPDHFLLYPSQAYGINCDDYLDEFPQVWQHRCCCCNCNCSCCSISCRCCSSTSCSSCPSLMASTVMTFSMNFHRYDNVDVIVVIVVVVVVVVVPDSWRQVWWLPGRISATCSCYCCISGSCNSSSSSSCPRLTASSVTISLMNFHRYETTVLLSLL